MTPTDPWSGEETPDHEALFSPPPTEKGWCVECRRMQLIEDEFTAGNMTSYGEVEYHVRAFACGHNSQGPERVVGPAPGAPYAGVPTARGTSPQQLLRLEELRRQQARRDEG